ncbi:MAG: DNA alkylation repair protein [Bacteroidetes bacterium]|nr:MAG: DNA alkylation repair protein [Bacteroidota bacterium]
MNKYIQELENAYAQHANPQIAGDQSAYLKNLFPFIGLKTPVRRDAQKPLLAKANLPSKEEAFTIAKTLWSKPEREYHYFAQELLQKYKRQFEVSDLTLFEYMASHNSWWDSVDIIAVKLIGEYFKKFPAEIKPNINKWLHSGNMWLQRCAILFQLHYKQGIDTEILTHVINSLLGSDEFFINKAIGWILREYGKTNPEWVLDFVDKTDLHPLSRREAIRRLV